MRTDVGGKNSSSLRNLYTRNRGLFGWLGFGILFILVLFVQIRLHKFAFDDAYIHFRIAKNFLQTGVPYYNPSEMVMASSSTGWTLLLTWIFTLFPSPLAIVIFNSITTILGAWVFSRAIGEPGDRAILSVAYVALILPSSIGLMETPVTLLLLAAAIFLFKMGNHIALVLFGVLPFFRLELTFISLIFIISALFTKKFKLSRIILYPLMGGLPFLIFDFVYFHTIFPNTINAKLSGYELSYFSTFISVFSQLVPGVNLNNLFFWALAAPFIVFMSIKAKGHLEKEEKLLLISGLIICTFYILGKSLIFPWYAPLFTIILVLPVTKLLSKQKRLLPLIALVILLTPVILSLLKTIYAAAFDQKQYSGYLVESRVEQFIDIGKQLYRDYPGKTLMASEIGGLGWGYEGEIIDGFGLVSPRAIKYQSGKSGAIGIIPLEFIQEVDPDIIASHEIFIQDFIQSPYADRYDHYAVPIFPNSDAEIWGGKTISVYIRNDILE